MTDKGLIRFLVLLVIAMVFACAYLVIKSNDVPDGLVDSYYYCHEDDVLQMADDMFYTIADPELEEGQYLVYNEYGYSGFPTLEVYDINDELVLQIDTWDLIFEYCSFDDGYE